jgi:ABC-2 type transport system ATP-binding protein
MATRRTSAKSVASIDLGQRMLVEIADLQLSLHGLRILAGVSLHMQAGEIYGLLGPNGAGKSTTLSVLAGLRPASSGRASVLGLDPWRERRALHRRIGVLPEQAGFYDWMSGADYLIWVASLYGRNGRRSAVGERLAQVGLDPVARAPIGTYSRGMKQRLGLARALLKDPELLVLDEPTNGLDPRGRREIHDVLLGLSRERKVGVLLCTHLLDDVERLCSRIGVIHRGRTVLEGSLSELLARRQARSRYRLRLTQQPPAAALVPDFTILAREGEWWYVEIGETRYPDAVWSALLASGWPITEIHRVGGGLEALYMSLTDEEAAA